MRLETPLHDMHYERWEPRSPRAWRSRIDAHAYAHCDAVVVLVVVVVAGRGCQPRRHLADCRVVARLGVRTMVGNTASSHLACTDFGNADELMLGSTRTVGAATGSAKGRDGREGTVSVSLA